MIIYHADDYGINKIQSERIIACLNKNGGVLNSVSIMPNSIHLSETIPMLPEEVKKGIHINLAEGYACADLEMIPLLHKGGVMYHTFLSLLKLSIIKNKQVEEQTSIEIFAQIQSVTQKLSNNYKIRIDSHVHYHMIPAVFRGMCKALKQSGYDVEYIRYPDEKLSIYLRAPKVWRYIRPVNVVKMILLKVFGLINRHTLEEYGYTSCTGLFFGVAFTSEMYGSHILDILKKYKLYAKKTRQNLETLFHPGGIVNGEEYLIGCNDGFKAVYSSENRVKEAGMLHRINSI